MFFVASFKMARNAHWKIVYRPNGVSELYDVVLDPRELANLWNMPNVQGTKQAMMMGILEWFVLTSDVTPLKEDPRGVPPAPAPSTSGHTKFNHSISL